MTSVPKCVAERGWPPLFAKAVQVSSCSCSQTAPDSCSREWLCCSLEDGFYGSAALEYIHSTSTTLGSPKIPPGIPSPQWDSVWRWSLWEATWVWDEAASGTLVMRSVSLGGERPGSLLSPPSETWPGRRLQQSLTVLPPWPWTSRLQNEEKIILFCLSPVYGFCFGSPCWLIHTASKYCYMQCIK